VAGWPEPQFYESSHESLDGLRPVLTLEVVGASARARNPANVGLVLRFVLRRLAIAALLVLVVSSSALVLAGLAPGDFATESLGFGVRPETVAATRARYGLDRPLASQYLDWLGRAVRFDFGQSLAYDRPVRDLVAERAGNTALLAVTALLLATLVGLPLGVLTGVRDRGPLSAIVRTSSLFFLSLPPLLTSLLLVFVAARTGWLPVGGMRSTGPDGGGLLDIAVHMIVPVLALALPLTAMLERLQSDAMADASRQPFILAVISRGISRRRVIWRHAFKTALTPITAMYGVIVGTTLSGSFAVEIVTAWPGLGRLMLDALRARDVYLVAGCAATGALFLAAGTLLSDLALAYVNPRTRE
jgi:peptide/nickel transport system permease protein